MKQIKAIIRPSKVAAVTLALHKISELSGMNLFDIRGFGSERLPKTDPPVVQTLVDYVPYAVVEILCPDDLEDEIVETIEQTARTGKPGDGKIFVINVSRAVRIATGDRNDVAVQRQNSPSEEIFYEDRILSHGRPNPALAEPASRFL